MRDALVVSVFSILPRRGLARWMGRLARTPLSRWGTAAFVRAYGVDLSEAEPSDLAAYPTLEALFTRRLRAGARPVDPAPGVWVSPADGVVAWAGTTEGGAIEVAPGRPVHLGALLGAQVEGPWDAFVVYLSPTDYHRVHSPLAGRVERVQHVPGTLWPVFPAAVRTVRGLFARNERVVLTVAHDEGPPAWVALIGAFGVGRIEAVGLPGPTNEGPLPREVVPSPALEVARGGELGVFHLGSTVVVAAPSGSRRWTRAVGDRVRVGQRIAEPVAD